MGEVVDEKKISREEEDGENIAYDDLAMEIIQFRYKDVDKKCDDQEETADAPTDGVTEPQNREALVKALWFINKTLIMFDFNNLLPFNTLKSYFNNLSKLIESIV